MTNVPIIAVTGDPIRFGIVSSIARPGGSIPGVSVAAGVEIWGNVGGRVVARRTLWCADNGRRKMSPAAQSRSHETISRSRPKKQERENYTKREAQDRERHKRDNEIWRRGDREYYRD